MSNLVNQAAKKTADKRVLGASVTNIENRVDALTVEQAQRLARVLQDRFSILIASVTQEGE